MHTHNFFSALYFSLDHFISFHFLKTILLSLQFFFVFPCFFFFPFGFPYFIFHCFLQQPLLILLAFEIGNKNQYPTFLPTGLATGFCLPPPQPPNFPLSPSSISLSPSNARENERMYIYIYVYEKNEMQNSFKQGFFSSSGFFQQQFLPPMAMTRFSPQQCVRVSN